MPPVICTLKKYEWAYVASLLKKGYPLQHAFAMVVPQYDISSYVEAGMEVSEIVLRGHQGAFYRHLRFFLAISGFADAIEGALHMDAFEQAMRKKLVQKTSYPIFLFIFSFVMMYFFSYYLIPQLMQSFDIEKESKVLFYGISVLRLLVSILLITLLLFGGWLLASRFQASLRAKLMQMIMRFSTLPAQVCSYTLAGYLLQLLEKGYATRQALSYLLQLDKQTQLYHCVEHIHKELEEGKDIVDVLETESLIAAAFLQAWRIGMHTQDMQDALCEYIQRQEDAWERLSKRISLIIQCSAYSFVAIMVVLVYQIMFIPLQLLENF